MAELEIRPSAGSRVRVAFVIFSAACITGTLVFLLSGGGPDSFSRKATISTYMPDVTGLAKNSEVRLDGIRIGHVTNVDIFASLDPQRAVRVDMKVVSRFLKSIPRDAQTSVGADTLVGYKFVAITGGKSPLMLGDNGELPSEPLQQAGDRADLILLMQTELRQVNDLLIQVSSPDTKLGRYVLGDKEYNDVLKQVSIFEKSMNSFVSPKSVSGQALFSNKMYSQIREPMLRVEKALAAMQRGEGASGRFFASDEQYNQILKGVQDLRTILSDANAGKGQLGVLLNDPAAYEKIRAMLTSTDQTLSSLQSGNGKVMALLKNPQLYASLNGTLTRLQALVLDVRTNPKKYLRHKVF